MFDLPFEFFSLVIAVVALAVARKAFNQVTVLRARKVRTSFWYSQASAGIRSTPETLALDSPKPSPVRMSTSAPIRATSPVKSR